MKKPFPEHFSLIHDKPDHFMIHDGKTNQAFPVAKSGLHPAHQIKIMQMKKFAEGGDVDDETPSQGTPPMLSAKAAEAPVEQTPGASGSWEAPSANSAEMPQTAQPGTMPNKLPPDVMQQFQANQQLEEKGLQAKGQAEAQQGKESSEIYKTANDHLRDFMAKAEQDNWNHNVETENLAQEVANSKIDPTSYMHNMSTGSKIANAIAMIVGGIGAGLTHGPNMAIEAINKAIANDIDAQKHNLGKKQSLLSMNMERYKDQRMAQQATMMQMNAMAQGQIAATAAKYGGMAGQAGTNAALGALKNKNLQDSMGLKQQVFQQQLMQHLNQGDVSRDNPLDYVRWTVPPDKQKEVADELGKAKYTTENEQKMLDLWDKARAEQSITSMRTAGGFTDGPAMKALKLLGSPLIHDQMGRVNEFEQKNLENVLPSHFQLKGNADELRKGFQDFIENKKSAPMSKTYGIDINKFNATKDLPQDQIKTVNGIQYKRGPNGEAIRVK